MAGFTARRTNKMGCDLGASPQQIIGCTGLSAPALPSGVDVTLLAQYANRIGAHQSTVNYIIAVLTMRRFIYSKNGYSGFTGNCSQQSSIQLGNPELITSKVLTQASSVAGVLGANIAGFAIAGPLALAAFPFAILGGITAHHAAAVAR
jgi:hypothetical protein